MPATRTITQAPKTKQKPWRFLAIGQPPAVCPAPSAQKVPPEALSEWSQTANRALVAVIGFRSAIHRWQAAGGVNPDELAAEIDALSDAGLMDWLDELIGSAMVLPSYRK